MDREAHRGISPVLASALAQLSRDGIMLADQSCRVIVASQRALRILRRDHQQLVGRLLSDLIPNLRPMCTRSEAPSWEEEDYDGSLVELRAGEFVRTSVTPVPDGGSIAFVVRIERARESDADTERNIERYDAFLGQIARYLGRFETASDALEGILALTALALDIPSTIAFVLNNDGSHDTYEHNMPQAIAESALHYFKACARELDDRPVLFEWHEDQPHMLLRDTKLRSAAALRIAQTDRGIVVLAAFSKMDGRFGTIEKTFLNNIAHLFDGVSGR